MPRLSHAHDQARRRIADLTAAGLAPERLAAGVMSALERAIGLDGYRMFGVDPQTLLVNRLLAASESDGWARRAWLQHIYLAAEGLEYIELPNLLRANLTTVAFQDRQEQSWGYPPALFGAVTPRDHHRRFHELGSPVGGTLLGGFAAGGQWVAALQAYRRDPNRPFRRGDVTFVRQIAPTVGLALAASMAREDALRIPLTPEVAVPVASGILLLDPDGRPRFATPAGESWLGLLGDVDRDAHAPLPTAIWSAVAGLRAGGEDVPANVLVAPSAVGPVRIEASPAGPDGALAIVLAPVAPPTPPDVPLSWPLTRQERAVGAALLRGHGNRDIAAHLSIAEHTVEWHLRRAYAKLEVTSRTQLLAKFFRDVAARTFSEPGA